MHEEMFKLVQELSHKIDALSNKIINLEKQSSSMQGMIKGFYVCLPVIVALVCYVYNSDTTRYNNEINNLQQMYFKEKEVL